MVLKIKKQVEKYLLLKNDYEKRFLYNSYKSKIPSDIETLNPHRQNGTEKNFLLLFS